MFYLYTIYQKSQLPTGYIPNLLLPPYKNRWLTYPTVHNSLSPAIAICFLTIPSCQRQQQPFHKCFLILRRHLVSALSYDFSGQITFTTGNIFLPFSVNHCFYAEVMPSILYDVTSDTCKLSSVSYGSTSVGK